MAIATERVPACSRGAAFTSMADTWVLSTREILHLAGVYATKQLLGKAQRQVTDQVNDDRAEVADKHDTRLAVELHDHGGLARACRSRSQHCEQTGKWSAGVND